MLSLLPSSRITYSGLLLLQTTLLLLCVQGALSSTFTLVECNQKNAEQGLSWCKDAFKESYHHHKTKLITSPKRTGCCLSHRLGECMTHSFTYARCDPKEQKAAILIKKEIQDAQNYINKAAEYLGTLLCGDVRHQDCGDELLRELDTAMYNITVLNGAAGLTHATPLAALGLVLAVAHNWP